MGIVGPTASGKTALSLKVAQRLRGEIICMDSMQIYRRMNIGTAKPTQAELAVAPHHMVDILEPDETYSVTRYAQDAAKWIDSIPAPILVGGTGQYLQALSLPMDYGTVSGNEEIRQRYRSMAREQGVQAVHDHLQQIDPASARRLHPNDVKRVIRAIEVFELTGTPLSRQEMPAWQDGPYDLQLYALDLPRDVLYRRIDQRVEQMMKGGLLAEVEALLKEGLSPDAQSMQGLGYKELIPVLQGKTTLADAVAQIQIHTRHYAKRQLTWFKKDGRIRWIPAEENIQMDKIADEIVGAYAKGAIHGTD